MSRILAMLLLLPITILADVAPNKRHEVAHLLTFVKQSGCEMKRNGSWYNGEEAVAHIRKKYDYFRREIESTEDFIKFAASKSTMSGQYYTARCNGRDIGKIRDWLLRELTVFRMKRRF